MKNDKLTKPLNIEVTDKREIRISFDVPSFFFIKGIHTKITQRDLLKIIRQIQDQKLKEQLKTVIVRIDELSEYRTDIDKQPICRRNEKNDRSINGYAEDLRTIKEH